MGAPICIVEDGRIERKVVSPPSGQVIGMPYYPPGSTRYGANTAKGTAAVGIGEKWELMNYHQVSLSRLF